MVDVQCMSKILTDSDVILMVGGATTRCRPLRAYSLLRTAMDRARITPRAYGLYPVLRNVFSHTYSAPDFLRVYRTSISLYGGHSSGHPRGGRMWGSGTIAD